MISGTKFYHKHCNEANTTTTLTALEIEVAEALALVTKIRLSQLVTS